MDMWLRALRVIPATAVFATSAAAQSSGLVDEGTFTITRAGAPHGTESFRVIRRLGTEGVEYVAQCTRTMEGKIVRTSLTADSVGNALSYSRATTGAGQGQLTARRAMNRLTVNEEGPQASSRDYVFAPGSVILDDDVIHQVWFVTLRAPRSFGFVAPAGRVSGQAVLTEVGRESVTVGGTSIQALHYVLGTGDDRTEVWIDSSRRLLKVAYPARQIVGTRDLPPR